jgi:hypothetical protein
MITEWKQNTNYYLKLPIAALDTEVNLTDLAKWGYPETIEEIPQDVRDHYGIIDKITLGMLVRAKLFLSDNLNVVINIQVRPYRNFLVPSSCVKHYMSEEDFPIALQMYQVEGFLSQEEVNNFEYESNIH